MALSDLKIRSLKPKEKAYKAADERGLFLLVNPTGSKLWRFKYRIRGKEKLLSIGSYPEISLAQARTARESARSLVAIGKDPSLEKQKHKAAELELGKNTFSSQAIEFLQKLEKEGKSKATLDKATWLLGTAMSDFGTMPIKEVNAPIILKTLRKIEARGHYETAKRLRSRIGGVFRYAVANGIADTDPTYALKDALISHRPKPRSAIIDPKEFGALLRAIEGFNGHHGTKFALKLLALLAQRPGEIRNMKWADIDIKNAFWTIPAEQTKMRRAHKVPLQKAALQLLDELEQMNSYSAYVFPSVKSLVRPISDNTLNGALRRLGFTGEEMTAHGFRASFSTLANESGKWHPDAIERQLAHIEANAVRRAYARGEHWDERVFMMEWWAEYISSLKHST